MRTWLYLSLILVILASGVTPAYAAGGTIHLPLVLNSAGPDAVATDATAALQAALGAYARTQARQNAIFRLGDLHTYGEAWAYGFAHASTADGTPLPDAEALLLAYAPAAGEWHALAPRAHETARYLSLIDRFPAELLDTADKAFFAQRAAGAASSSIRTASFSGHHLPWAANVAAWLGQRDGEGHAAQVDFDIAGWAADGDVYASKPGTVAFVKQNSGTGCASLACWQQTNLVVIQHGPAEFSWYAHLAAGSVPVRVGDTVGLGTRIGTEGASGFANGVHLHYMVSASHTAWTTPDDPNRAPWALDIQAVDFAEVAWDALMPGQWYTSLNGATPDCGAPGPSSEQVALYEHAGYCGLYTMLEVGDTPDLAAAGFYHDRASSVRVGEDVSTVICTDVEFGGTCESFSADDSNLTDNTIGNDLASSARVELRPLLTFTPTLTAPADTTAISDTTPTLQWIAASDAITYQIQVSVTATAAITSPIPLTAPVPITAPVSITMPAPITIPAPITQIATLAPITDVVTTAVSLTLGLVADGNYRWRVQAQNAGGEWSSWSITHTFVVDTIPPPAPLPATYADGARLESSTLTFTWTFSDTAAVLYRLVVLGPSEVVSPTVVTATQPVAVFADLTLTDTVATFDPMPNGLYEWRVASQDAAGNWGAWSETRTFVVDAPWDVVYVPVISGVRARLFGGELNEPVYGLGEKHDQEKD